MPTDPEIAVIVVARDEAAHLGDTFIGLREAFGAARLVLADDASRDHGGQLAREAGVEVVRSERPLGKGGIATRAARHVLSGPVPAVVVLCDGDLGLSARELGQLAELVRAGGCDLAVAAFARRLGGGFGLAVGFARWAVWRRCGLRMQAPISGQRAIRGSALDRLLPFAARFGMETAMTIDAVRGGLRVQEIELDLHHAATGRTAAGFLHRARQLSDFAGVYLSRRRAHGGA
ncbi:MAG TPA: glycosyltransferase [Solirubrobacteraceae bacterium]|jgi:hypothetical protein|nr:glycosyltransferase [Solirubrobacteraceae bacterium]